MPNPFNAAKIQRKSEDFAIKHNQLIDLLQREIQILRTVISGGTVSDGTLTIGNASATQSGLLTSTDWNTFNNKFDAMDFGIADDDAVQIDSPSVADNDYAKFTANGLEGRDVSEVLTDLGLLYPLAPASPHTKDDEFDDTSLDAKWSWINQGTSTWTENSYYGIMTIPSNTDNMRMLVQTAPSGDYYFFTKLYLNTCFLDWMSAGLCLYNSSNGYRLFIGRGTCAAFYRIHYKLKMSGNTTWVSDSTTSIFDDVLYFRIRVISSTYYMDFSCDGINWNNLCSEAVATWLGAITHIGIASFRNNTTSTVYDAKFEYFRVVAL